MRAAGGAGKLRRQVTIESITPQAGTILGAGSRVTFRGRVRYTLATDSITIPASGVTAVHVFFPLFATGSTRSAAVQRVSYPVR